jgi:hypothetical protein
MSQPHIPNSILLLGAGELGTAVLSALSTNPALSKANTRITVLLRPATLSSNPSQLNSLREICPRVEFVSADFSKEKEEVVEDLVGVLEEGGYDTVVGATGFAGGAETQLAIAKAVLRAGRGAKGRGKVERYFPWQFGVDYDIIGPEAAGGIFAEQCGIREILRNQQEGEAVEWTIVSTGMFMSFVFEDWFGVVEGLAGELKGENSNDSESAVLVRGLGGWSNQVTLTAVEDIAKVVADILVNPVERNDKNGSIVYTAGQTVTYGQLADIIERVVGAKNRGVKREDWPVEYHEEEWRKDKENQLKKYRLLFGEGRGVSWDEGKTLNVQRGLVTVGVEEWLRNRLRL